VAHDDSQDFAALKLALQVYAQARARLPEGERSPAEQELGELLVSVVGVADRLRIDLVRAAENHIAHKAENMPRLVRAATPPGQR
jgi:hypothetical protein